jgi:uncharacterized protein
MEDHSVRRRDFMALALLPLTGMGRATIQDPARSGGPHFLFVSRDTSRVFLLGCGEARDESWFSSPIQRAFDSSSSLWLETAPPGAPESQADAARIEQLRREPGRSFFDALEPSVRSRVSLYINELGIKQESIESLRPWKAYYVIMSAYYANTKLSYQTVLADEFLRERATAQHKALGYELPTHLSFVEFMANMSDKAQSEYIAWLLDYLDDCKKGLCGDKETFGWIHGDFTESTRNLNRMRTKMPELYAVMQVRRNAWWARKITDLLEAGGIHFMAVGNLHAMGPDGIPAQLSRLGITMEPVDAGNQH